MASLTTSPIFLSILLAFVTITPLAHGQLITIIIRGVVSCTPAGNPPATGNLTGVVGAIVTGSCSGVSGSLGTVLTNATGAFEIISRGAINALLGNGTLLPCSVSVTPPLTGTNCTVFLPTGILQMPVTLLQLVVNLLGGITAIFRAG